MLIQNMIHLFQIKLLIYLQFLNYFFFNFLNKKAEIIYIRYLNTIKIIKYGIGKNINIVTSNISFK